MKILGIDSGLRRTGWAILEVSGQNLVQIALGTAKSESSSPLPHRLLQIYRALGEVITLYEPDEAAVEETFVNKDAAGALKLGQARAMALLAPIERGIEVSEYAPNQIKKSVTGQGHADKSQIEYMVKLQVKGFDSDCHDATDAMAVAMCHSFLRRNLRERVA